MYEAITEAKREIFGMAMISVGTAGAYAVGGPALATSAFFTICGKSQTNAGRSIAGAARSAQGLADQVRGGEGAVADRGHEPRRRRRGARMLPAPTVRIQELNLDADPPGGLQVAVRR